MSEGECCSDCYVEFDEEEFNFQRRRRGTRIEEKQCYDAVSRRQARIAESDARRAETYYPVSATTQLVRRPLSTFRGVKELHESEWKKSHGFFPEIPAEIYHASTGAVSRGMITDLMVSPAHLKAKLDSPEEPDSEALTFGTLAHGIILEGKTLDDLRMVARPEGLSFSTKEGKAWRDANSIGKKIIKSEDVETVADMREAIRRHPTASSLVTGRGIYEGTICVPDPWKIGLSLRCRPDFLPENGNSIIDLKTARSSQPDEFRAAAWKHGYFVQAAFYILCAEAAGFDCYEHFTFVAVEKKPPYAVEVYHFTKGSEDYHRAVEEIRRQLAILKHCRDTGEWPGYTDGQSQSLELPRWPAFPHEKQQADKATEPTDCETWEFAGE